MIPSLTQGGQLKNMACNEGRCASLLQSITEMYSTTISAGCLNRETFFLFL